MSRTNSDNTESPRSRQLAFLKPFVKGQSGNPAGRPKSARSKLSELFLREMLDACAAETLDVDARMSNLRRAIYAAMQDDPAGFVRMVASLLPKNYQVDIEAAVSSGSAFADLLRAYNEAKLAAAKQEGQSSGH